MSFSGRSEPTVGSFRRPLPDNFLSVHPLLARGLTDLQVHIFSRFNRLGHLTPRKLEYAHGTINDEFSLLFVGYDDYPHNLIGIYIRSMTNSSPLSTSDKFSQWITRLLVRFGRVKNSPMEFIEINQMLNGWLPVDFDIAVPGGRQASETANLKLVSVDLTTVALDVTENQKSDERLWVIIDCNFEVKMNRSVIFRTKLRLELQADPDYCVKTKSIGVCNAKLCRVELVDGKDSFIKDMNTLANGILPTPLKGLFNVAMASTKAILGDEVVSGMTKYLSLYNSGNQQRIVDYHKKDIENKIIELTDDSDFRYQLDSTNFEEKLFSDYGKKITIQDGELLFEF